MKLVILISAFLSQFAFAQTLKTHTGQTFQGIELLNERPTGNSCFVVVHQATALTSKGYHCYDLEVQFAFQNDVLKDLVNLTSRVTNYHTARYPTVKTCATNLQGQTSTEEIYGLNTDNLYTPFFSAMHKIGGTQYDYFLTFDADTKLPVRARVNIMKWISEKTYDCTQLQSL